MSRLQGDVQILSDKKVQSALPPVVAHFLGADILVSDADGVEGVPELRLDYADGHLCLIVLGFGDPVEFLFVIFLDADNKMNLIGNYFDFRRACNLYISVLVGVAVARVLCLQ